MPVINIEITPPIRNHKNNIVRTTIKQRIVVGTYHVRMIIKYHCLEEIGFEINAIHSPPKRMVPPGNKAFVPAAAHASFLRTTMVSSPSQQHSR